MPVEIREWDKPIVGEVALQTIVERVPIKSRRINDASFMRFKEGVEYGKGMVYVTIAINNVWGAYSKSGGDVSSYERIGYHAGCADFIRGLLSTDCPVYAYYDGGWHLVTL